MKVNLFFFFTIFLVFLSHCQCIAFEQGIYKIEVNGITYPILNNGDWGILQGYNTYQEPRQGWKIHIGSNRDSAEIILNAVLKKIVDMKLQFKITQDLDLLASYGKLITIYPKNLEHAFHIYRNINPILVSLSLSVNKKGLSEHPIGNTGLFYIRYGVHTAKYGTLDPYKLIKVGEDYLPFQKDKWEPEDPNVCMSKDRRHIIFTYYDDYEQNIPKCLRLKTLYMFESIEEFTVDDDRERPIPRGSFTKQNMKTLVYQRFEELSKEDLVKIEVNDFKKLRSGVKIFIGMSYLLYEKNRYDVSYVNDLKLGVLKPEGGTYVLPSQGWQINIYIPHEMYYQIILNTAMPIILKGYYLFGLVQDINSVTIFPSKIISVFMTDPLEIRKLINSLRKILKKISTQYKIKINSESINDFGIGTSGLLYARYGIIKKHNRNANGNKLFVVDGDYLPIEHKSSYREVDIDSCDTFSAKYVRYVYYSKKGTQICLLAKSSHYNKILNEHTMFESGHPVPDCFRGQWMKGFDQFTDLILFYKGKEINFEEFFKIKASKISKT